jgi:translation initiation factor 1
MNHSRKSGGSALVYTTGQGRICPNCRKPVASCSCQQASTPPFTDGIVRIRRETKGRAGKGVTVITGVPLGPADLDQLAKQLKQRCGTGGTVKNDAIEIQGDHRDLLLAELAKKGWTVKKAGG